MIISFLRKYSQTKEFFEAQAGRSKAYYTQDIEQYSIEDLADYFLVIQTMERIRSGQGYIHSATDVRKDLDLDD